MKDINAFPNIGSLVGLKSGLAREGTMFIFLGKTYSDYGETRYRLWSISMGCETIEYLPEKFFANREDCIYEILVQG